MLLTVSTDSAPKAIGPYSQAITCNGFVFVSGQIPIEPATGHLHNGTIEEQTRLVLTNLSNILKASGSSLDKVAKTTIYLLHMGDFDIVNRVYSEFFAEHKPARATVQVARLPKDVSIEIDAIALV